MGFFGTFALLASLAAIIAILHMPETRRQNTDSVSINFKVVGGMERFLVVVFLSAFASALIQPVYLIYLQDSFSLPMQHLVIAFLPAGLVFAILPSKLGRLTEKFGNTHVFCFGMLLAGVVYLLIPLVQHFVAFVVIYTISAVGWAMSDPARKALASEQGSELNQGQVFGVTELKLIRAAALQLMKDDVVERPLLDSWNAVLDYCHAAMSYESREQFRVLFLDKRNRIIADEIQQIGTVDHTPVYTREVVKRALELSSTAIILLHNHPSGDPEPSRADIVMTKQIVDACRNLGIVSHDHIVIGREGHVSFRARGLL